MKKIFTLAIAVLASLGMWAQTVNHSYSFDSADELNKFVYTAGDNSDEWGIKTAKSQVDPRDGGFLQYKNAKSAKTATFVTKDSFNEISNISFYVASSDKGKTQIKIEISPKADFSSDITEVVNATGGLTGLGISSPSNNTWYPVNLEVNKASGYVRFTMTASSSGKYWSYDDLVIVSAPACTAPEKELVLKADKEVIYVGDEVTFTTEGGNGNPVTIVGANGNVITDKWTAVEGKHKFLASQEAAGDVCAQESFLELTVLTKNPVTAVTIDGPKEAYVGEELVYTATAANAAQYAWLVDGIDANTNAAEFKYTAVEGEHSIVCKARNDFNATDEWIASEPIAVKVSKVEGALIHYDLTGKNGSVTIAADAKNIIGGTADQNTETSAKGPEGDKGYKLGSAGHYVSLTLASGSFQVDDVVRVYAVPEKDNVLPTLVITSDKEGTDTIGIATDLTNETSKPAEIVLTKGAATVYLSRPTKAHQNPVVKYIEVVRPEQKEIDHVVISLSNVQIEGKDISAENLATLRSAHKLALTDKCPAAPTVTFFEQTETYYVDEATPKTTVKKINVVAVETTIDEKPAWEAKATVNEIEYTVTLEKVAAVTITYMYGETKLGEEIVALGGKAAENAKYESQPLAEFGGWYRESTLENAIDLANEVINADITVYAKFETAYAKSVNIEQWILDNGQNNAAFKALLLERGYAYENIDQLDSLDDSKSARNEPYLGLKLKKKGAKIGCYLKKGEDAIKVKFGNVADSLTIGVNGEYRTLSKEDALATLWLGVNPAIDRYVEIITTTDKTIVIKQIMINEDIAEVVLPDKATYVATCDSTVVNGTISINGETSWKGHQGDTVVVTYQPAIGYQLDNITVDGKAITPEEGLYYFIMPAKNVTVSATFKEADPIVPPTRYAITIAEMQNGTVTADKEYASATELVTLTVTPAEGYKVADVKVNGVSLNPTNNTYSFEMPEEDVTITATFEPAQEAMKYLVTIAELENGSIRFADLDNDDHKYYEGDLVHLIIIPAEGYKLVSANAGNEALQPDENGNCSFRMPGQDVTVSATFEPESQGIEDANITKKAVKVIRDGQVLIIRDGKMFNALGAEVK